MSENTPKALEADCTTTVFGPVAPSKLALRGFRFVEGEDGGKPTEPEPKEPAEEDEELDLPRAKAAISKANREAAALRKRLADVEKAEKEREDAKKDDLTRAQEANAELQSKLDAALARNDRLEIAIEKKLTVKQANRLSGSTREELEADADEFLADLRPADDKKAPPQRTPREALRGGGDPTNQEENEPTADEAAEAILKSL